MAGRDRGRKIVARQRSSSFRSVARLMLLPIAGLLLLLGYSFVRNSLAEPASHAAIHSAPGSDRPHAAVTAATVTRPDVPSSATARSNAAAPQEGTPQAGGRTHRGDIVLILDDVGFDHQPLAAAMTIDPNLNFAILPNGAKARESAARLNAGGFEILCHLPMEPVGYPKMSPGANAILTSMSDAEITRTTRANIDAIPNLRGVNNHMGSRATQDRRVMGSVLRALPKNLYFIDSLTTGSSVAGSMARAMSIPTASRRVFLDDVQNESAIRHQLASLTDASVSHGVAVGIGHIYPVTVKVLNDEAPRLRERGFRFVRASEAVN